MKIGFHMRNNNAFFQCLVEDSLFSKPLSKNRLYDFVKSE